MYPQILISLVFAILAEGSASAIRRDERACNNAPHLCSKPYDTITHLGAHDSPFIRDSSTSFSSFGNQFFNTTTQLDAGVRLLSAQVHVAANRETNQRELHICHSSCTLFDAGALKDWLWEIRTWMDAHPHDIITLILVNVANVDARELEWAYSQADISHYGYVPPNIATPPPPSSEKNATWPTLEDMINRNERLVSFVNPLTPDPANAPYILNEFDFVWENAYAVTENWNFTCTPDRPAGVSIQDMVDSGRLFMMNHMKYWQQGFGIQVPDIRFVNETNSWDGPGALGRHMMECGSQLSRQPTFVLVDFFNVGPAMRTVDNFNHVNKPIGRLDVPTGIVGGGSGVQLFEGFGSMVLPSTNRLFLLMAIIAWILMI